MSSFSSGKGSSQDEDYVDKQDYEVKTIATRFGLLPTVVDVVIKEEEKIIYYSPLPNNGVANPLDDNEILNNYGSETDVGSDMEEPPQKRMKMEQVKVLEETEKEEEVVVVQVDNDDLTVTSSTSNYDFLC